MNRWKHWGRWAIAAVIVVLLASSRPVRTYWTRYRQMLALEKKLAEAQSGNRALAAEVERIKNDPQVLETAARSKLGLLKPGEVEYRFVDSNKGVGPGLRRDDVHKKGN